VISVIPIVMCGGSGSRLWPLSRAGFPKQFLCLPSQESLFQQAVQRLMALGSIDSPPLLFDDDSRRGQMEVQSPLIVTGEEYRFIVTEQLRELGIENACAILEPSGRNTAPALTLAAFAAIERGCDPVLVVTPADQLVADVREFTHAMYLAIEDAANGSIVIFGVQPDAPNTGYGYIQTCLSDEGSKDAIYPVNGFVEKPNLATAEQYLKEGNYFWNAGIFVMKASVWLKALESFRPDILRPAQRAWKARAVDGNVSALFIRPDQEEFELIPSDSIDFAVMERCPGSAFATNMVLLKAGWSDLGTWNAVWQVLPKDANGNALIGDVRATNSCGTLAHASSRLVSLVGVKNLIVIETSDAVLVTDKAHCQNVKEMVALLETEGRKERVLHREVHRPWGWFDTIYDAGWFKVKRIGVRPGAAISLQRHFHRSEHWIVVKGTAEVICGQRSELLSESESIYIPLGEVHRLKNPSTTELEIIEVQTGSYLGEDDIERLEDNYGRR
jgi:mannose-1-phosphate guanylyltransferase / mannose-6-phosphate isomerase